MGIRTVLKQSAVVMGITLLVWASGCSKPTPSGDSSKPEASAEKAAAKPRVALVMKSLANEFFQIMEKGAKEYQSTHAAEFDLLSNGIKDEQDVNRQVQLVEQMIAQKVQAIVIAPADSKALIAVCKRAQAAGIVVVNIDNRFDPEVLAAQSISIPFIGPDNRKGAKLVADYLAKSLNAGDPVAVVEGIPTAFNGQQRKLGFEDAIKEAKLNVVASQVGDWEMDKASRVVSAIVSEHPDVKAILCANDSMALGAVSALKAANKIDAIKVIGYDGINAVRELIKQKKIAGTIEQHADQLAVYGIQYALELIKTHPAQMTNKETPVDLITIETLP